MQANTASCPARGFRCGWPGFATAAGGRRSYQWDFDEFMDIYVVNFDGTGMRQLTDAPGYDAEASYSHDGKHIVFASRRSGRMQIYTMLANGTQVKQLTTQGENTMPVWSR